MASADLREELDCSICLTTYTDPVMLRCGHNFCRVCIDQHLNTQDGSRVYSCPECREEFQERPALMRNFTLLKIMENILTTQPTPRETGIFCSYCVDSPVPAVRSCLHCEASLYDKHRKGPADILLDVNTALNFVYISDDLKTATWAQKNQKRPETSERFQDYPQVMSSRRFTSGRHYWEVEISESGMWMVGMCYPSIDRRGDQSCIGGNNKSWGLWTFKNKHYVIHDSNEIRLPDNISSDRFRICLDYEAGELSFYELCDPIRHLHTFTTTFTEPLHAALWVGEGSIKILGGVRTRKKPSQPKKSSTGC